MKCCQGSDCLNLKVIDGGPGCSVEDSAGKQIVDASYSACKHFTGSTSCGWSDRITVTCTKTSYTEVDVGASIDLGPCSSNSTAAAERNIPVCSM